MTFGKRLKLSLLAGCLCTLLGSGLLLFLIPSIRTTALAILITCAAVFGLALLLVFLLEGKSAKIRVPVFTALVVVAVLAVSCVIIYNFGNSMVYHPAFDEDAYEELTEMKSSAVELSADGLSGWRIPAASVGDDKPRPVILYFGGNGENSSRKVLNILNNDELSFLYDRCDFIFIDYPSYGLSEGTVSESALRDYALRAYDIAVSLDTTSSVTVFSYSLGNGPAVYLASRDEADISNLVLLAPYNSGLDLFNNYVDIFHGPFALLASYRMPVYSYASDVTCPVTIIASADDEIIPIESSRALFSELSQSNCNFITVEGVLHNDFMSDEQTLNSLRTAIGG